MMTITMIATIITITMMTMMATNNLVFYATTNLGWMHSWQRGGR